VGVVVRMCPVGKGDAGRGGRSYGGQVRLIVYIIYGA